MNISTKLIPYIPSDDEKESLKIEKDIAHVKLFRVSENSDNKVVEYLEAIVNSEDLEFTVVSWGKKNSSVNL